MYIGAMLQYVPNRLGLAPLSWYSIVQVRYRCVQLYLEAFGPLKIPEVVSLLSGGHQIKKNNFIFTSLSAFN